MRADYDLIVIGAGSAGLTAARFARSLGLSVAIIERSPGWRRLYLDGLHSQQGAAEGGRGGPFHAECQQVRAV